MTEGTHIDFQNDRQKSWITILLLLSCVTAGLLLWKVEPVTPVKLTSTIQLDSLITRTMNELNFPPAHIQQETIEIDSVFSRKVYFVQVAPRFSKTTLHYYLQQEMWPYNVETIAFVEFPDEDMTIHLIVNDKIHRTLYVESDPDIQYVHQNFYTPPDHEMD